jgi:hypothetical protein
LLLFLSYLSSNLPSSRRPEAILDFYTYRNAVPGANGGPQAIREAKAPAIGHNLRSVSDARLQRALAAIANDYKAMLGKGGLENRGVIRAFLAQPVELIPEGEDHYRLRGEVKVGETPYAWCRGRDSNPHSVATART